MADCTAALDLIAQKRLYQARVALLQLQQSGARVYGLEANLQTVEAVIARCEALAAEGDRLLSASQPRSAAKRYGSALRHMADRPQLEDQLRQAQERVSQGRSILEQAVTARRHGNDAAALERVRQALAADGESPEARSLCDRLSATVAQTGAARRFAKRGLLITLGSAVAISVVALVLGLLQARAAEARSRQKQMHAEVESLFAAAQALIEQERFGDAQERLATALRLTEEAPGLGEAWRQRIHEALHSDTIVNGAAGLLPLDGQWLTPQERQRVLEGREGLHEDLTQLTRLLEDRLRNRLEDIPPLTDFEARQRHFELLESVRRIPAQLRAGDEVQARAAYQKAVLECNRLFSEAGLVRHGGRWVVAEENTRSGQEPPPTTASPPELPPTPAAAAGNGQQSSITGLSSAEDVRAAAPADALEEVVVNERCATCNGRGTRPPRTEAEREALRRAAYAAAGASGYSMQVFAIPCERCEGDGFVQTAVMVTTEVARQLRTLSTRRNMILRRVQALQSAPPPRSGDWRTQQRDRERRQRELERIEEDLMDIEREEARLLRR